MRVLVTGGAGFIGSNLVRRLTSDARIGDVRVLDDLSTGDVENLSGCQVELVKGSILDHEVLEASMSACDSVVHLAARPSVPRSLQDPMASHAANATGTLMVLEAARRVDAYVCVASSSSVYGANATLPKREDMACRPLSPYAVSKQATESYAIAYAVCFGLPTLACRFFNVFGPLQAARHAYAAVIPAFISSAIRGQPLTIHGDGRQTRDFTYVGTVVDILAQAALSRVVSNQPVNLAFGTRTSLLELIELLEEIFGHELERRFTDPRSGDVRDSQADNSALRSLFPAVEPVPLDAALRDTVEWARSTWLP